MFTCTYNHTLALAPVPHPSSSPLSQGASFQDTILAQMRRRQEEAARKAEAVARARASELHAAEQQGRLGGREGEGLEEGHHGRE